MSCPVCQGYDSHRCPVCGSGPRMKTCPECEGTGKTHWTAWDNIRKEEVEITEEQWMSLVDDISSELSPLDEGGHTCSCCRGTGEVPEDY